MYPISVLCSAVNNTALFSPDALGTRGNATPRPFYGPGVNNFDTALHKVMKLTESKSLAFETFNTFNHAQFDGNGAVDGNVNDATLGKVVKAAPPRISQVALKFLFEFGVVQGGNLRAGQS
jgi:hypothetical protein